MSAYELGIKAYNNEGFLATNPFNRGTKKHQEWDDGLWDAWFSDLVKDIGL